MYSTGRGYQHDFPGYKVWLEPKMGVVRWSLGMLAGIYCVSQFELLAESHKDLLNNFVRGATWSHLNFRVLIVTSLI